MEFWLSVSLGTIGLFLLSFGTVIVIMREQPWHVLDHGFTRVMRTWIALGVGTTSVLLGIAAVASVIAIFPIWL